jgi:putative ABC transport system permease protein
VALIALTALIYRQVGFCGSRETGFKRDNIVVMQVDDRDPVQASVKCIMLKEELLRAGVVTEASVSYASPGEDRVWIMPFVDAERPENETKPLQILPVDYDYLDFYDLTLKEGRRFSKELAEDNGGTFIVSESAARAMGLDHPVGASLSSDTDQFKIVGVVSDFSALPATYEDLLPVLQIVADAYSRVSVKLQPGDFAAQIGDIEATWQKVLPDEPFNYAFLEDVIIRQYQDHARMATMGGVFAAIAVFVACLGVLGLASFAVERRIKEIGIRKVLGASVPRLIWMFGKETLVLVVISILVAAPVVRYVGNVWLEEFPHRVAIGLDTLAGPGCLVLLAAIFTVGVLALKAARSNPVEALRYE